MQVPLYIEKKRFGLMPCQSIKRKYFALKANFALCLNNMEVKYRKLNTNSKIEL